MFYSFLNIVPAPNPSSEPAQPIAQQPIAVNPINPGKFNLFLYLILYEIQNSIVVFLLTEVTPQNPPASEPAQSVVQPIVPSPAIINASVAPVESVPPAAEIQ